MNVNIRLAKNFVTQYNKMSNEHGEELARLNGFADSQLSYTDFIDNFIDKDGTVADASIDANANVGTKDICSLQAEMSKPHSKLLAFNKIYHEMNKAYGFQTANEWLKAEWVGDFYLHDASTTTFFDYCYAYDLEKIVTQGMVFQKDFNHEPPKHLMTYTDFVGEFVSYVSNRSAGACGLPSFLIYSYYFWKKDCENHYLGMSNQEDYERYRDQEFQRITYKLNQCYLRVNQSAFTNFSIFDREYLTALFGGKTYPDGTFVVDYIEELIEYQKSYLRICSDIRSKNMMTFPVISISLLRKDDKFVDEDFAKWCVRHNMKWNDSNFFGSDDINSLSNCCRLQSNIKDLGYFNSIGGTALEVGSVKVNTINLARIAYESETMEQYYKILTERTILCCKVLDRIRYIISRNIEKGLLPTYVLKLKSLKSQYNTIGIIGIYEALTKFNLTRKDDFGNVFYTDEGLDFAKKILSTINEVKTEFAKDKDYSISVEEIPGERAAAILKQKDQFFFPDELYELPLYGNQWIPLGVQTTIQEKIRLSAALDKACGGGSIAHINLDAPTDNFDATWKLINYIFSSGVIYFAFNVRINACEKNHGFYGSACPECGGEVKTTYQRIVGFLTPTRTYSKERKEEFGMREWLTEDQLGDQ